MARVDPSLLRWWLPYRTLFADGTLRLKGNGLMAIVELIEAFDAAGFKSTAEGANAPAAYFASFPGTIERNRRRDTLTEGFLVRRMRLTAPWTGPIHSAGPLGGPPLVQATTDGCTPFRFDPYVSEAAILR